MLVKKFEMAKMRNTLSLISDMSTIWRNALDDFKQPQQELGDESSFLSGAMLVNEAVGVVT